MLGDLSQKTSRRHSARHCLVNAGTFAIAATFCGLTCSTAQSCPPVTVKPRQCLVTKTFDVYDPAPGSVASLANPLRRDAESDLKVVVLGDSVMWGNGLPVNEKFVGLFSQELANLTGRKVRLISYAHSGARLGKIDDMNSVMHVGPDGEPFGDLDSQRPTTTEQEECAAGQQPDAEIVLLDGCINDVGATKIALPFPFNFTDKKKIAADSAACLPFMHNVLTSALGHFPNATIIDVNYYRVVSTESQPFLKNGTSGSDAIDLTREQQKLWGEAGKKPPLPAPPPNAESPDTVAKTIQPWSYNSDAFLATSQDCFHNAVAHADGQSGPPCTAQFPLPYHSPLKPPAGPATAASRVYLATVEDKPEFAYGAPQTHLWRVPIGETNGQSNQDDFYSQRKPICEQVFQGNPLEIEKCLVNPTAHPNAIGARAYRDSLLEIIKAAWVQIHPH